MIHVAAQVGYDSVGLRIIPMRYPGEPDYELSRNPQLLRRTKAALETTGLIVNDIELCRIEAGMNPQDYAAGFEAGAELGASHVICSIWSPDRDYSLEMLEGVCALGRSYGLTIDLEYVTIAQVRTLAQAADILHAVGAENIGLLLDMYHVHRARTEARDIERLPREWFNFCHLCDAPARIPRNEEEMRREVREGRLYLGAGGIDVAGILSRAPNMIYAIELPNRAHIERYGELEHARRALQSAKAYLAAHPRPSAA